MQSTCHHLPGSLPWGSACKADSDWQGGGTRQPIAHLQSIGASEPRRQLEEPGEAGMRPGAQLSDTLPEEQTPHLPGRAVHLSTVNSARFTPGGHHVRSQLARRRQSIRQQVAPQQHQGWDKGRAPLHYTVPRRGPEMARSPGPGLGKGRSHQAHFLFPLGACLQISVRHMPECAF